MITFSIESCSFVVYFSVVEFRTRDDMERAVRKLDGSELNGRKISLIEVNW